MKKPVIAIILLFFATLGISQELAYNINISDYLYLNPAFAGSKNTYRAALNSQLRWYNAIHQTYYNSFSFDFPLKFYDRLGVGVQAQYNQLSTGFVNSAFSLSASFRIGMLRHFIIIPGLRLSYKGYYLNTDNLVFYDQLSIYDGVYTQTAAQIEVTNFHVLNASAGLVIQFPVNFNRLKPVWVYGSYYVDNIPEWTLPLNQSSMLYYDFKYTVNGGVLIPVFPYQNKTHLRYFKGLYFYPNIRYFQQSTYNLLTLSSLLYKKPFLAGFGYQTFKNFDLRNKTQFIATLGYQGKISQYVNIQFLYSFDLGISITNKPPFITHELSMVVNFVNLRKNDCPGNKLKFNPARWFNPVNTQQRHPGECPPGKTKRRTVDDIFPSFYPIELPKPYEQTENFIF